MKQWDDQFAPQLFTLMSMSETAADYLPLSISNNIQKVVSPRINRTLAQPTERFDLPPTASRFPSGTAIGSRGRAGDIAALHALLSGVL
jgi:hypothetical protein